MSQTVRQSVGFIEPKPRIKRRRTAFGMFRNVKAVVGIAIILLFVLVALFVPVLAPYSPTAQVFPLGLAPDAAHWLGTNSMGQDLFSQLLWGTRTSLLVAFSVGIIATTVSLFVGITAGYLGGWVDRALTFVTNVFLVIPSLPLVIVLSSYIHFQGEWPVIGVISLTSWAWGARSLRAQALTLRERDYVLHAQLSGQPWWSVVLGEILPNMASLVLSGFLFTMIHALLTEASLDFLGLGNINVVSWGTMLYWAQNNEALVNGMWWWFIPPGLAIAMFGGALSLINFSLDEFTNPRLRKQKKVKIRVASSHRKVA